MEKGGRGGGVAEAATSGIQKSEFQGAACSDIFKYPKFTSVYLFVRFVQNYPEVPMPHALLELFRYVTIGDALTL